MKNRRKQTGCFTGQLTKKAALFLLLFFLFGTMAGCTLPGMSGDVTVREYRYSFEVIPFAEGQLSWGMSSEEVSEILGTADNVTMEDDLLVYTYGKLSADSFGECTDVRFYFDEKPVCFPENNTQRTKALFKIRISFPEMTENELLERCAGFYGAYRVLRVKSREEIGRKLYVKDEWTAGTLQKDEYNALQEAVHSSFGTDMARWYGESVPQWYADLLEQQRRMAGASSISSVVYPKSEEDPSEESPDPSEEQEELTKEDLLFQLRILSEDTLTLELDASPWWFVNSTSEKTVVPQISFTGDLTLANCLTLSFNGTEDALRDLSLKEVFILRKEANREKYFTSAFQVFQGDYIVTPYEYHGYFLPHERTEDGFTTDVFLPSIGLEEQEGEYLAAAILQQGDRTFSMEYRFSVTPEDVLIPGYYFPDPDVYDPDLHYRDYMDHPLVVNSSTFSLAADSGIFGRYLVRDGQVFVYEYLTEDFSGEYSLNLLQTLEKPDEQTVIMGGHRYIRVPLSSDMETYPGTWRMYWSDEDRISWENRLTGIRQMIREERKKEWEVTDPDSGWEISASGNLPEDVLVRMTLSEEEDDTYFTLVFLNLTEDVMSSGHGIKLTYPISEVWLGDEINVVTRTKLTTAETIFIDHEGEYYYNESSFEGMLAYRFSLSEATPGRIHDSFDLTKSVSLWNGDFYETYEVEIHAERKHPADVPLTLASEE